MVLILVGIGLFSYERFLERNRHRPSIAPNADLWSWYRYRTRGEDPTIVLLGASRMQLNINTALLRRSLPDHRVLELTITGLYPMATLQALAEDQDFAGTVVVSLNAQALESRYHDMQAPRNEHFSRQPTRYAAFDAYLSAQLRSRLRARHPMLRLDELVKFYDLYGRFRDPFYVVVHADLSRSADFSLADADSLTRTYFEDKLRNYTDHSPTPVDQWLENIGVLNEYVEAIQERGGQVILVRLPTDKAHWQLDQQYYPREEYWDKLAERSLAPAVHFQDVEGLDRFDLPDASHLDQRNSPLFTAILFNHIQQYFL